MIRIKGNDGTGNTIERDEWETKQELWNKIDEQYKFSFDCCATQKNTKCFMFSSDFLNSCNNFMSWMNPPFSKAQEMFRHFFRVVKLGVAIYRCDNMETKVWQDIILLNATWILIPKGRISYEGMEGNGSRFPSALIGIGVEPPRCVEGIVLEIKR